MKNSNHLDFANSLKGKVALVTGGSGGIGYECVNQLIVHGARVIFTYVEGRKGESIAKKIVHENPNNLFALPLDLQSYESISNCIDNALNHWGKLDILINNAGVAWTGDLLSMPSDRWKWLMQMNLTSVFQVCLEVVPFKMLHQLT